MNGWTLLLLAIVLEVIGSTGLKASQGFSKLLPSLLVVLGYAGAFYFLSLALKTIPLNMAYAVWSGAGHRPDCAFGLAGAQGAAERPNCPGHCADHRGGGDFESGLEGAWVG